MSDEYAEKRAALQAQLDAAVAEMERTAAALQHFREWCEQPRRSVKCRGIQGARPTYRVYDEVQRMPSVPGPTRHTMTCSNKEPHDRHWHVVRAGGITYAQGYCEGPR